MSISSSPKDPTRPDMKALNTTNTTSPQPEKSPSFHESQGGQEQGKESNTKNLEVIEGEAAGGNENSKPDAAPPSDEGNL